jgi:glucokinase
MATRQNYSIGVDLGGTNLRTAAIDERGELHGKVAGRTNLQEGRDAVIEDMVEAIRALQEQLGFESLEGVGVAVPGFIDMRRGVIVGSNNLRQFDGFPVRDEISRRLDKPVILENDANAAALGEKWQGAGREVEDLVLLTLGTGIGGGIVSGGRVLHGALGMAGEFGHMTVYPGGNPCGCGNDGCLEKHASATAVTAMARLLQLGDNLTAEEVFAIAQGGAAEEARRARRIFESMGRALGIAIGNLVNIFNAPLYLLSGGPLPAWEYFAPAMLREVEKRSFTFRNSSTRIEKAALGGEAGLYGAACLPFQQRGHFQQAPQ